jgi:hypothetical protein
MNILITTADNARRRFMRPPPPPPPPAVGQQAFTIPGTYTWTVPEGVYEVCVVVIGPGAQPRVYPTSNVDTDFVAMGGGLRYKNRIAVTPGDKLTIVVGSGGSAVAPIRSGTIAADTDNISSALGIWAGTGHNGTEFGAGVGGGVGGNAGTPPGYNSTVERPGSAGLYTNGTSTQSPAITPKAASIYGPKGAVSGVDYGVGGTGRYAKNSMESSRSRAGHGAVRIIWGEGRAFPSTKVADM